MDEDEEINVIDDLIKQGEGQFIEFKKSDIFADKIKIAKEMVAFANASGGTILFGLYDDGRLEGMVEKKDHELYIMNIANDKCNPPIRPEFSVIKKEGGDIYFLKISRFHSYPHAVKTKDGGVYYLRMGTTVREITPSELAILFESVKSKPEKKPKLDIKIVDNEKNYNSVINAEPIFIQKIDGKSSHLIDEGQYDVISYISPLADTLRAINEFKSPFEKKIPASHLVPIEIVLLNNGDAPAKGIRIKLVFPDNCVLYNQDEVEGGWPYFNANYKGLYIYDGSKNIALAHIETLSNDDTMEDFDKIYVEFPPEEQRYPIYAHITQHNYPPLDCELSVFVKPKKNALIKLI